MGPVTMEQCLLVLALCLCLVLLCIIAQVSSYMSFHVSLFAFSCLSPSPRKVDKCSGRGKSRWFKEQQHSFSKLGIPLVWYKRNGY